MGYTLSLLFIASGNTGHFYLVSVRPIEATGFETGYVGRISSGYQKATRNSG